MESNCLTATRYAALLKELDEAEKVSLRAMGEVDRIRKEIKANAQILQATVGPVSKRRLFRVGVQIVCVEHERPIIVDRLEEDSGRANG